MSSAASTLAALRGKFASMEAMQLLRARPLNENPLPCCCSRGLLPAVLHEVAAARESEMAAATGFMLPLVAWAAGRRAVAWIADDRTIAENGTFYGPGFDFFGLGPEQLTCIAVPHERDVFWAMEEALRCRALGAVIGELRGARRTDLTASRRLSLAAGHGNATAFLLRASPTAQPLAAVTRWVIGTAPSAPRPHELGPPRFAARLTRNRRGNIGSWLLEWNSVCQRFDIAAADRQPVAGADDDRPHRAAASG
jgi:protein ImuA